MPSTVPTFWIGIAIMVASVVISFVWPQKHLPIRVVLLVLGLAGAILTAYRYLGDQNRQQQTLEYWDVAYLNAIGLTGYIRPEDKSSFIRLVEHSAINNLLSPFIKADAPPRFAFDCRSAAMQAYTKVIQLNKRFPFSYFYRGSCDRGNKKPGWERDYQTALTILRITTKIPGHNQNHDQLMKLIEEDNPHALAPPGFTAH
jgi:hypothetical protein